MGSYRCRLQLVTNGWNEDADRTPKQIQEYKGPTKERATKRCLEMISPLYVDTD